MFKTLPGEIEAGAVTVGLRVMTREDIPNLGRLFLHAYVGTADYEGETEQDAIAAVQATFDGEFGEFIGPASVLVEQDGRPISASFVTRWQAQPLLAFTVTEPKSKGKRLAEQCISASMLALVLAGHKELHLYVTPSNASALSVYHRLGFRPASAA